MKVLSAGAVQPGLNKIVEAFRREADPSIAVDFATAPAIAKRIAAGEPIDIVIAPMDLIASLTTGGKLSTYRVLLGDIGVGALVRAGAPLPEIATVAAFERSLQMADRIVYNQASTGIYLDSLFHRLGIAAALEAKTIRYPDFAAVRDHVAKGDGKQIGFGATTVIVENTDKGIAFAGALPAEIQNYTRYAAALTANGGNNAMKFLDYLATPAARSMLKSHGID